MSALFRARRAVDFDGLYRRHAPTVYRYTYAVLGNQADAEDVTQQTFLNAYRSIEQGTKPRKAENWLLRIAHNEVRRHFRKNGTTVAVQFDDELAEGAVEPAPVEPTLADVLRALRKLTPMQRSALVMREFEGRSYAEIAEILEITQSALEALLFRARRALAEELEEALSCTEAEQAISLRLDGRLAHKESRRLRRHLHACGKCVRLANLQKRQRSVLKGLSVMPIPASLFLFRGEQAVAAGLGGAAAAGTGAGVTVVAKAAAVTAAVAVTGGVGYGVATEQRPAQTDQPKAALAASLPAPFQAEQHQSARMAGLRAVPIAAPKRLRKQKAARTTNAALRATKRLARSRRDRIARPEKGKELKLRPVTPAAERQRARPERGKKAGRARTPSVPARGRTKAKERPQKPDPPRGKKDDAVDPPPPAAETPPARKPKP